MNHASLFERLNIDVCLDQKIGCRIKQLIMKGQDNQKTRCQLETKNDVSWLCEDEGSLWLGSVPRSLKTDA